MSRLKAERQTGFSILELMVAAGLLAVIMLGLLQMFYQTERAFRLGVVQADTMEAGRSTIELITRDFQELTASGDPMATNLFVQYPRVLFPITYTSGELRNNALQPFFLLRRVGGEWRGVRYDFLATNLNAGLGMLHRLEFTMPATNAFELSTFLEKNNVDASLPGYGQVADGIINLTIRAHDVRGNLLYYDNDPAGWNLYTNLPPDTTTSPFHQYAFRGDDLPAYVEVELGVLEPKLWERVKAIPNDVARMNFLNDRAANIHYFRQRIPIRSTP